MNNYPAFGAYNQQLQQVQNQLASLQGQNWQYSPVQPNMTQPVMSEPEQIHTVIGLDGAKAYLQKMPPNSSAILMDNNDDVFYSVKKDANGMAFPIAIGRFTLETEQEQSSSYVTKKDLEDFKAELKSMFA